MVKIAINGFGRIGRNVLRAALSARHAREDLEFVAINDLTSAEMLAHLLTFDSVHGRFDGQVTAVADEITVNGKKIPILSEKDPEKLPWKDLAVDVVVEATGLFRSREGAQKHLAAGAKKVIITAPGKEEDVTLVMGVNEEAYDPHKHAIISNASCTTNCLAPVAKVLDTQFGIVKGMMTTVHSYTNGQRILDLPHKDFRRARAAGLSIIPTTTGAAKAVALVLPQLKGKLDGFAMRVPTPNVSVVDLAVQVQRSTTKEEVNAALKEASETSLKGIMNYTEIPMVSVDFTSDPASSTVDGPLTMVIGGDLVKVISWYDNEMGYSHRVVDLISMVVAKGL